MRAKTILSAEATQPGQQLEKAAPEENEPVPLNWTWTAVSPRGPCSSQQPSSLFIPQQLLCLFLWLQHDIRTRDSWGSCTVDTVFRRWGDIKNAPVLLGSMIEWSHSVPFMLFLSSVRYRRSVSVCSWQSHISQFLEKGYFMTFLVVSQLIWCDATLANPMTCWLLINPWANTTANKHAVLWFLGFCWGGCTRLLES